MSRRREKPSSYPMPVGDLRELARLKWQSAAIGEAAGGTVPEIQDLSTIHTVVDLACGTGEWTNRMAREFPRMHVTGVDISKSMIEYAQSQAEVENLSTNFRMLDILDFAQFRATFAEASVDFINMRMIAALMKHEMWVPLLKECFRILRPGGYIRSTEQVGVFSNDPRLRRYTQWWIDSLHATGQTFAFLEDGKSPDFSCPYYCTQLEMPSLLEAVGYDIVEQHNFDVNFSYGTRAFESMIVDLDLSFQTGAQFIVAQVPRVSAEDLEDARAYLQSLLMPQGGSHFRAWWHLVTIIGQKPLQ